MGNKIFNTPFFHRLLFKFKYELITMKYLTTNCLLMDQLCGRPEACSISNERSHLCKTVRLVKGDKGLFRVFYEPATRTLYIGKSIS